MKKLSALLAALLLLQGLTGCALSQPESSPVPIGEADPAQLSEAELRQRIAEADGQDAELCYQELLSRDLFTREDYEALAGLYEQSGQTRQERDCLLKLLLLYPSEDTARRLSEILVSRGPEDSRQAALVGQAVASLRSGETLAVRDLVNSEDWNAAFQDGLRAVEIRSVYTDEEGRMQIRAGYQSTELSYLAADGAFWYFIADREGTSMAAAAYSGGAYNGPVYVEHYDAEDNLLISYTGTLSGNLCVEELLVNYDGTEYTGSLNEDSTTAEKQETSVTNAGGVIYARSGNSYLYQNDAELESFVLDCTLLGLPVYEPWD